MNGCIGSNGVTEGCQLEGGREEEELVSVLV